MVLILGVSCWHEIHVEQKKYLSVTLFSKRSEACQPLKDKGGKAVSEVIDGADIRMDKWCM